MDNELLETIYIRKHEQGKFEFLDDKEFLEYNQEQKNKSHKLFSFIGKNINEELQIELKNLIEEYVDVINLRQGHDNELFYKSGFYDALNLIEDAKKYR